MLDAEISRRRSIRAVLLLVGVFASLLPGGLAYGASSPWSTVGAPIGLSPSGGRGLAVPRYGQSAPATVVEAPDPYVGAVALAPSGALAAGSTDGGRGLVQVRAPGGRWSSVPLGPMVDPPVVAFDGRGRLCVVGWRGRGQRHVLVRRERDAAGRWSPAKVMAAVTRDSNSGQIDPALALDGHGRALVTWAADGIQYAAFRDSSDRWSRALRLGAATTSPTYRENRGYAAAIALAADGTAWVAWEHPGGRIALARHADGTRRFARRVLLGMRGSHRPALSARSVGGAVVAWVGRPTIDDTIDSGRFIEAAPVLATVVSRSGVPRAPTRLSNPRTGASEPFLVTSSNGETTVAWQPDQGSNARYASAGPDGRFEPAQMLAGVRIGFGFANQSPMAMLPAGTAVLLAEGPHGSTIYARRPTARFRRLFEPPPERDEFNAEAEGGGLTVAGHRILAVLQVPSHPDVIDPTGEVVLVASPPIP